MFDLFFRILITGIVGVYSRYFFFKLIGKSKSIEYLSGSKDNDGGLSQGFVNAIVGIIITSFLVIGIAYLIFSGKTPLSQAE